MIKRCKICHENFNARSVLYKCCSPSCRRKNHNEASKRFKKRHPEAARDYLERNRDKIRAQQHEYYMNNKEKIDLRNRRNSILWAKNNPEKIREKSRRHYQKRSVLLSLARKILSETGVSI